MVLFETGIYFEDVIKNLQEIGVFNYVLPFLLVFSIFFAILEKTKILGDGKTNINVVVSSVAALLVLAQQGIVDTINIFIPRVSLIMLVILMGLLIIAMVAGKQFTGITGGVFSIAVILIIIAVIMAVTIPEGGTLGFYLSERDRATLLNIGIPLAIFLIAIAIVTAKPKEGKEGGVTKLLKSLEKGFSGGSS